VVQLRAAVECAGGHWLPARPLAAPVAIDGECRDRPGAGARVLCAHFPSVFPAAAAAGYCLVLAGHLHGGQCVLATYRGRQFPAAWFHRWHGLRFAVGGTTMLVSRGVADTLPLRFNCPREVLVCDVV
jgi:predicted MPP superfamily phosphohydrolase